MPLAVLSAMREASTYHVTVKGGKFLEALSEADTIVFDKTGTLTHACPVVADVIPFGGREANEMLRVAACLEEHFPHSMAERRRPRREGPQSGARGNALRGAVHRRARHFEHSERRKGRHRLGAFRL